jgi:hypothetical protein
MSHTHEDRVADRPGHLCAAYGCPLIGSMSTSTQGSTDWWCFAHFGADIGRYQTITSELNRMNWLAAAARDVRMFDRPGTAESKAAFALIEHELTQHQRPDLLWNRVERRYQWLERLEAALRTELIEVIKPIPRQETIITEQSARSFERVGFDMPM